MDVLSGIFYFIILVGVLVFIHEGGHFAMAKLFGVKVHVFSLGMGPRIFGFIRGETDYRISAVPVGGYVRMLGEDPSEVLSDADRGRALTDKPAWQRTLILAAGPFMNLIFPVFLYFFLSLGNTGILPAEVGSVLPGGAAAAAGFQAGDEVLAVNGVPVSGFSDMVDAIEPNPGKSLRFRLKRGDRIIDMDVVVGARTGPEYPSLDILRHLRQTRGRIGVAPMYDPPVIGIFSDGSFSQAGLRTFDRIEKVNGKPVARLVDIETLVRQNAGSRMTVTYRRLRADLTPFFALPVVGKPAAPVDPGSPFEKTMRTAEISIPPGATGLSDLGVESFRGYVVQVMAGSAAEKVGLARGDKLVQIDGRTTDIYDIESILIEFDETIGNTRPHRLTIRRGGVLQQMRLQSAYIPAGTARDLGIAEDVIDTGFRTQIRSPEWAEVIPPLKPSPAPIYQAWSNAWRQTVEGGMMIIDILKSLVTGNISFMSFSGPIGIGTAAAQMGNEGLSSFVLLMGFVSLNLGLLNLLLPIPILDGGRLILVGAEAVMRRRLSPALQERIMVVGAVMTIMLMVWAVIMDIARAVMG